VIADSLRKALDKAGASTDPEVSRRAKEIVAAIEMKLRDEHLTLIGHTDGVRRVCVSADGKRLLTSSEDGTLRLWYADTGDDNIGPAVAIDVSDHVTFQPALLFLSDDVLGELQFAFVGEPVEDIVGGVGAR
jgi:WD40 repeat protein